jgi:hypothetical protein
MTVLCQPKRKPAGRRAARHHGMRSVNAALGSLFWQWFDFDH